MFVLRERERKNYEQVKFINNFIIRVGSGIVIFRQGLEKFTGDFTLNGLVPVIRDNTDSPQWYKWFSKILSPIPQVYLTSLSR